MRIDYNEKRQLLAIMAAQSIDHVNVSFFCNYTVLFSANFSLRTRDFCTGEIESGYIARDSVENCGRYSGDVEIIPLCHPDPAFFKWSERFFPEYFFEQHSLVNVRENIARLLKKDKKADVLIYASNNRLHYGLDSHSVAIRITESVAHTPRFAIKIPNVFAKILTGGSAETEIGFFNDIVVITQENQRIAFLASDIDAIGLKNSLESKLRVEQSETVKSRALKRRLKILSSVISSEFATVELSQNETRIVLTVHNQIVSVPKL